MADDLGRPLTEADRENWDMISAPILDAGDVRAALPLEVFLAVAQAQNRFILSAPDLIRMHNSI